VRRTLDVWPPLPVEIECFSVYPWEEDNVIAALERPNRVRNIMISHNGTTTPLERLVTVMQEPFPAIEYLSLRMVTGTVSALPNTFLGGSAPRLRSLHLHRIPFPTLPRLLLSSNDLVDLSLSRIPHSGYIPPEAMAMCISALTSLTDLSIGFESPASHPDPITRRPPPLRRAILPALTNFDFYGVSEYLEDLMTRTDAPLLQRVKITLFNQLVFDIQQLTRFIDYAPALRPYYRALIHTVDSFGITFWPRRQSSIGKSLSFNISCKEVDLQASSFVQICNQLSFVLSSIEELTIDEEGWVFLFGMDDTQWLELFQPFTAVQTMRIFNNTPHSPILSALRGLSGGSATQVLPALEELRLLRYQALASQHDNWPFIVARQCSDHPVVVRKLRE
jgi:hypothetical protein